MVVLVLKNTGYNSIQNFFLPLEIQIAVPNFHIFWPVYIFKYSRNTNEFAN